MFRRAAFYCIGKLFKGINDKCKNKLMKFGEKVYHTKPIKNLYLKDISQCLSFYKVNFVLRDQPRKMTKVILSQATAQRKGQK